MSVNPFWEFSLEVYARPGVAEACIALQDGAALDVNLILFCLWSAAEGPGLLDDKNLEAAIKLTGPWQNTVVKPVRAARRAAGNLKTGAAAGLFAAAFQRDVAATELSAERVEQWQLYDAVSEREPAGHNESQALRAACENLARYVAAAGAEATAVKPRLELVLSACFTSVSGEEVTCALSESFAKP